MIFSRTRTVLLALVVTGCATYTLPEPPHPREWRRNGHVDPDTNKDQYECQREAFALASDENGRLYLHASCMRARGYAFVPI